jgi:hypothetical protein
MFSARDQLASGVSDVQSGHGGEVALTSGGQARLAGSGRAFIYRPGPLKGKAQITAKYSNEETIERINRLNASKYLTGTKVAEGEDLARVTGTEDPGLLTQDLAGTTSFSASANLLAAIVATSLAIPRTGLGGGTRLTQPQVGLVKLMVLNDALANTMVRYQDLVGQAQEKNIQRFFPKSRRDEYVKTIAQADLDATEMGLLRAEIQRTAQADAQLLYNAADPGALRTDEAFTEILNDPLTAPQFMALSTGKSKAVDPATFGPPTLAELTAIKDAVLGVNGALLDTWIQDVALAYTEMIGVADHHYLHDPNKAVQSPEDVHDYGLGNGGLISTVMVTSRGFTPLGGDRGAIYEMREREIEIDKSGWINIGSLSDLHNAIDLIFGAV